MKKKATLVLLSAPKWEPILPTIIDKMANNLASKHCVDFKYFPTLDKKYTLQTYQNNLRLSNIQADENIEKFNLKKYFYNSSITYGSYIPTKKLFEINDELYKKFSPGTELAGIDSLTARKLIFNLVENVTKIPYASKNAELLNTIKKYNFAFVPIGDQLLNDIYDSVAAEQSRINTAKNLIAAIDDDYKKSYNSHDATIISDIDMAHQSYIIPKLIKQQNTIRHSVDLKIKPICVYTKESEEDAKMNLEFFNKLFAYSEQSEINIDHRLVDMTNIDKFCAQTLSGVADYDKF